MLSSLKQRVSKIPLRRQLITYGYVRRTEKSMIIIPLMLQKIILYLFDMLCDYSPTIYSSGERLCFKTYDMVCHLFIKHVMYYKTTKCGQVSFSFSSAGSSLNDSFMGEFGIIKIPTNLSISKEIQYKFAQKLCSKSPDSQPRFSNKTYKGTCSHAYGVTISPTTAFKQHLCNARIILDRTSQTFHWMVTINQTYPICVHQYLKKYNRDGPYCFVVITDPQTANSIKWNHIEIE